MKEIIDCYETMASRKLTGYEVYNLAKYFIPFIIPMFEWERKQNKLRMEQFRLMRLSGTLPLLSSIIPPIPIKEKSIKDVYHQALVDYKDHKIDLKTVNYIEQFL